nr:unnamed protein product [Callosobruchus analis]
MILCEGINSGCCGISRCTSGKTVSTISGLLISCSGLVDCTGLISVVSPFSVWVIVSRGLILCEGRINSGCCGISRCTSGKTVSTISGLLISCSGLVDCTGPISVVSPFSVWVIVSRGLILCEGLNSGCCGICRCTSGKTVSISSGVLISCSGLVDCTGLIAVVSPFSVFVIVSRGMILCEGLNSGCCGISRCTSGKTVQTISGLLISCSGLVDCTGLISVVSPFSVWVIVSRGLILCLGLNSGCCGISRCTSGKTVSIISGVLISCSGLVDCTGPISVVAPFSVCVIVSRGMILFEGASSGCCGISRCTSGKAMSTISGLLFSSSGMVECKGLLSVVFPFSVCVIVSRGMTLCEGANSGCCGISRCTSGKTVSIISGLLISCSGIVDCKGLLSVVSPFSVSVIVYRGPIPCEGLINSGCCVSSSLGCSLC